MELIIFSILSHDQFLPFLKNKLYLRWLEHFGHDSLWFFKTFFTFKLLYMEYTADIQLRPWFSPFNLSIVWLIYRFFSWHGSFYLPKPFYTDHFTLTWFITQTPFTWIIFSLIVFSWFSYQQPLSFTFIEYAADIRSPTIIFTVWPVYKERWICSQCINYYYYFCSSNWKVERLVWR